jgi:hypothetical protein
MNTLKTTCLLLVVHLMFSLAGCGGGGGGNGNAAPTKAVVKMSTQGTVPMSSTIGGVQLTLVLPAGVTVNADSTTGKTDSGVVVASGVATGADVYWGTYTPATASADGTLEIKIANSQTGFDTGEFVTVTCDLAAGVVPKATEFAVKSDYKVFNLTDSSLISGIAIADPVDLALK